MLLKDTRFAIICYSSHRSLIHKANFNSHTLQCNMGGPFYSSISKNFKSALFIFILCILLFCWITERMTNINFSDVLQLPLFMRRHYISLSASLQMILQAPSSRSHVFYCLFFPQLLWSAMFYLDVNQSEIGTGEILSPAVLAFNQTSRDHLSLSYLCKLILICCLGNEQFW